MVFKVRYGFEKALLGVESAEKRLSGAMRLSNIIYQARSDGNHPLFAMLLP